jgi:hypothetical protein
VDFRAQAVFPLEHARANGVPVPEEAEETEETVSVKQLRPEKSSAGGCTKKAGILHSGLVDHEIVAGGLHTEDASPAV